MIEHLKPSLSRVTKSRCTAVVKWTARVTVKFTMVNGGERWGSADAIIIRRYDVEHVETYARDHCDLRDYLLIRLPMKIGLRTREIGTLQIEDIDFGTRSFQVLDSKKHRYSPLPLDVLTLQLIKDLTEGLQGLVFRHKTYKRKNWNKPLTNVSIWKTTRLIGEAAGVKGYNPRLGRHYFACKWLEDMKKPNSKKTIVGLQRILRHNKIGTTTFYWARLVFFEDIQKEFEETKNPYEISVAPPTPSIDQTRLHANFYEEFCSKCDHEPTCKFKEEMGSCQACSGCRFYQTKKEVTIKHE